MIMKKKENTAKILTIPKYSSPAFFKLQDSFIKN